MLGIVFLLSWFFGLARLENLTHQPLDATLVQVYYASATCIFFSAIYLRTGSLFWWTIVLHFLVIFTSFLLYKRHRLIQLQVSSISFSGYYWLPQYSCLIRPKKLEAIRRLSNWHFIQHSISTPIKPDFIKISYQVFIYSYQDFTDIRLLILL